MGVCVAVNKFNTVWGYETWWCRHHAEFTSAVHTLTVHSRLCILTPGKVLGPHQDWRNTFFFAFLWCEKKMFMLDHHQRHSMLFYFKSGREWLSSLETAWPTAPQCQIKSLMRLETFTVAAAIHSFFFVPECIVVTYCIPLMFKGGHLKFACKMTPTEL